MKKTEIDRGALNYNFLKRIIIRFDYDGMDDTELDRILPEISNELKNHGYTDRKEEILREVELTFDDPESSEYNQTYRKNIQDQKVFVFHNENPQVKLKISSTCACIAIEKSKYVNCLDYCHVLWKVMRIISDSDKVPFFRFTRFGLRKINQCFLLDIGQLNVYFEASHFRTFHALNGNAIKEKVMQLKDSFEINDYNINLVRGIIRGEIQKQEAYQVDYDADIYLLNEENIKERIQNESKIAEMNALLFELYKNAVTEKFLNDLIDGTINKEIIMGVESNGGDTV